MPKNACFAIPDGPASKQSTLTIYYLIDFIAEILYGKEMGIDLQLFGLAEKQIV